MSLAEYLKSKMGVLDAEEALKRERDRRRNAAEGERRKVQSERREKEYHARDERAKRGAELELAQREAMLARRAEEEKKDDDVLKRRRETEERRREQDVEELICKEDERIKLVDESSRAREVKRRETAAVRQEKDYLEVVTKESAKRAVRKAWEEEVRRAAERSDPQVVRADPGNPSVMKGHSKMIAPYAMQQRPMLARLGRWKHPADDLPDYTTAQPLHNQSFVLVREQRKKLRAEQADVRAFDRGFYVSRQWEAAH